MTTPPPPTDARAVLPVLVEPGPAYDWWEETPAQAARADREYWNED